MAKTADYILFLAKVMWKTIVSFILRWTELSPNSFTPLQRRIEFPYQYASFFSSLGMRKIERKTSLLWQVGKYVRTFLPALRDKICLVISCTFSFSFWKEVMSLFLTSRQHLNLLSWGELKWWSEITRMTHLERAMSFSEFVKSQLNIYFPNFLESWQIHQKNLLYSHSTWITLSIVLFLKQWWMNDMVNHIILLHVFRSHWKCELIHNGFVLYLPKKSLFRWTMPISRKGKFVNFVTEDRITRYVQN
jgi:hypothetical protein